MIPKIMRIPPERYCQNVGGISIKIVATLSINVNRITDTVSDAVMMYGFINYYFYLNIRRSSATRSLSKVRLEKEDL